MPSRKRNKGKERRKAKQEAAASGAAPARKVVCRHGVSPLPPRRHPGYRLIRTFEASMVAGASPNESMKKVINDFPLVFFGDGNAPQMFKDYLIFMGTDMLVEYQRENKFDEGSLNFAKNRAEAVILVDHYTRVNSHGVSRQSHQELLRRLRDVTADGGERGVTRFFSKRISCSCLDGMYAEVSNQPKQSACTNCRDVFKKDKLALCGGCNVAWYCSRECQKEHWPEHQQFCRAGDGACDHCWRVPKEGEEKFWGCGRCRDVSYCSRGCQAAAWPKHKKTCQERKPKKDREE